MKEDEKDKLTIRLITRMGRAEEVPLKDLPKYLLKRLWVLLRTALIVMVIMVIFDWMFK